MHYTAFLKWYRTTHPSKVEWLKEYLDVPDALLKKTQELRKYFDRSYAYVSSLRPKATTRKSAVRKG